MPDEITITPEDRRLAASALEKKRVGDTPTSEEKDALKRVKKAEEERTRWKYYGALPKKHYLELSGRQAKTVNEQAHRYGLPLIGAKLDLQKILTAFHDLLAENKHILTGKNEDPLLAGASQALKDEYVRQQIREKAGKATLAELEVAERQGRLVDREAFQASLGPFFGILRAASHKLQTQFGATAYEIYEQALDDAEIGVTKALEAYLATRDDGGSPG